MLGRIIIVGASLSGLYTALALSSKGFRSILVEKKALIDQDIKDGRAIALNYGSKQILEQIGIWQELESYSGKIDQIKVLENNSNFFLNFEHESTMGYLVESSNLLKVALRRVQNDKNILLIDSAKFELIANELDFAQVRINNITYNPELIIAADGKFSELRRLCNIGFKERDYKQACLITKIEHEKFHNNTAYEIFCSSGPVALLPLQNEKQSGIVWTETKAAAKMIEDLTDEKLCYFLNEKIKNYVGEVKVISEVSSYPLKLIMAENYFYNNIVLVGDSAHSIHPIAGQGFNLAIQDIALLTELLEKANNFGMRLSAYEFLSEYQKVRKKANRRMAIMTDCLNKLFSNDNKTIALARKLGLKIVDKLPPIKKFFVRYAMARND